MWGSRQSNDYSFSAGSSQNFRNTDSYDFDISGDDYSYSSPEQKPHQSLQRSSSFNPRSSFTSTGGYSGPSNVRRSSIEDRAKEILEKARASAPKVAVDDSDSGPSLQATFAELLQGIELPKGSADFDAMSPKASAGSDYRGESTPKRSAETPGDTSYGDSFELSAADLEVGTFAAKRMREKSAERGRRLSFDQPNFKEQKELSTFAKKSAASPDPAKTRKSLGDFQISTALSSIQRSKSFTGEAGNAGDFAKYGSLERSDDEIYKMLNVTGAQDSVVSRSFLASSANSSFMDRTNQAKQLQTPALANPAANKPLPGNTNVYNAGTNDSFHSHESYHSDDYLSHSLDREELLNSPVAAQRLHSQKQPQQPQPGHTVQPTGQKKHLEEEEEGYYDDDFETDVNNSVMNTIPNAGVINIGSSHLDVPSDANNISSIPKPPFSGSVTSSPMATPKHATASENNLNSVDEIMQRWYNADTNTLMRSLDDIGRSRSASTDTHSVATAVVKVNNANATIGVNIASVTTGSVNTVSSANSSAPIAQRSASGSSVVIDSTLLTPVPRADAAVRTISPAVELIQPRSGVVSAHSSPLPFSTQQQQPLSIVNAGTANMGNGSGNAAVTGIALAQSALVIPTWDEADVIIQPQMYSNMDNTNDTEENQRSLKSFSSDRESDNKVYSDNEYRKDGFEADEPVTKQDTASERSSHRSHRSHRSQDDERSLDRQSLQSKHNATVKNDDEERVAVAKKSESNKTQQYAKRYENVNTNVLKQSPSSVSDSDSNENSNHHTYRDRDHDENEVEEDEEDLRRYRRSGSAVRSASRSRPGSASPVHRSRNVLSSAPMNDRYQRSTSPPQLASSTRARLNAKRKNKLQSPAANPNAEQMQTLQKQNQQVLRKVFQLQDDLHTLRRSQSLERTKLRISQDGSLPLAGVNRAITSNYNSSNNVASTLRNSRSGNDNSIKLKSDSHASTLQRSRSVSPTSFRQKETKQSRSNQVQLAHDALPLHYRSHTSDQLHHSHPPLVPPIDSSLQIDITQLLNQKDPFSVIDPAAVQAEQDWMSLKATLVSRAAILNNKEKELVAREKIIAVKEAAMTQREALLENQETRDTESKFTKPLQQALEANTHLQSEVLQLRSQLQQLKSDHVANNNTAAAAAEAKQQSDQRRQLALEALQRLTRAIATATPAKHRNYASSNHQNNINAHQHIKDMENASDVDATGETLVVKKADYELLLRDYASQDMLLAGYQRENEKLVTQQQQQQRELQQQQARFFDERDTLNKELNTLRHLHQMTNLSDAAQSRQTLQQHLETDCQLRDLQAKNAQLTQELSSLRSQSAQVQDTLRNEIKHLQSDLQQLHPQQFVFVKRALHEKETENAELLKRVQRLAAQCDIQAEMERQLQVCRSQVALLRQELLRRRIVSAAQLNKLLNLAETLPLHQIIANNETHVDSEDGGELKASDDLPQHSVLAPSSGAQRNFADIKRIKELENSVRELQDAVKKRFPDSVASLIQVNKAEEGSKQQRAELARLQKLVRDLQQELDDQLQSAERRIGHLRSQQDAIRSQYESQISALKQQLAQARQDNQNYKSNFSGTQSGDAKQQHHRSVKELEVELQRSRAFYTRKIDDMQRKHEAQLRAIKRGELLDHRANHDSSSGLEESDTSHNNYSAGDSHNHSSSNSGDDSHRSEALQELHNHIQMQEQQWQERVSILQQELFTTTEELGKVKAELKRQQLYAPSQPKPPPGQESVAPAAQMEEFLSRRMQQLTETLSAQHQQEILRLQQEQRDTVAALRASLDKVQLHQQKSTAANSHDNTQRSEVSDNVIELTRTVSELETQLSQEKKRCAALTAALLQLQRQQQSATTISNNRDISEQNNEQSAATRLRFQVEDLQRRMGQREKELTQALQSQQTQQLLERQRLVQQHELELRLKDEQLLRFRLELTPIVAQLQMTQFGNPVVGTSSTTESTPHGHGALRGAKPQRGGMKRQQQSGELSFSGTADQLLHSP